MGNGKLSDGIQIAAPVGTPVAAAADGVVAYAGTGIPSLGGLVILKHGDGWVTVYGNASSLLVKRGQSVKRGQRIALSGQRSEEHTSEIQSLMRISYAVFCFQTKNTHY